MATRKYRKELLLTPQELTELRILAARFKVDVTSMIRILIQLGKESLPGIKPSIVIVLSFFAF